MAKEDLPSPNILRQLIRCNKKTGELFWKDRASKFCTSEGECKRWNSRFSGRRAFFHLDRRGYLVGSVLGVHTSAHWVVWAMIHGDWPKFTIDHIDGQKTNNSPNNLRDVSMKENSRNFSLRKDSPVGVTGVFYQQSRAKTNNKPRPRKPWVARIKVNGKNIRLGSFKTKKEAVDARKKAGAQYAFHKNHGKISASNQPDNP